MFSFDLKKVLSIGLLCAISQVALCANWEYATISEDESFTVYIDTDSIKKYSDGYSTSYNGNFRSAWLKYIYTKPQKTSDGKFFTESKGKIVMACHLDKMIVESVVAYDKQGNVVDSVNQRVATILVNSWDSIIPDTVGETMFNYVCK